MAIAIRNNGPMHLNVPEINMVNRIYAQEIRALALQRFHGKVRRGYRTQLKRQKQFLSTCIMLVWLTACTSAHGNPPPPPQPPPLPTPSCTVTLPQQPVILADGATAYLRPDAQSITMCGCTDGLVRWGAYCK